MSKIKRLPGLVFLLLAAAVQGASTNQFPLMAWDYADDAKTMEAMRDCGITSIAFVPPGGLDLCQQYGLKAIVFDERISGSDWSKPFDGERARRNIPEVVAEIGKHPAVYGYHIKDEPHESDFPELGKAIAAVKEFAPGKWPYINLFPGTGESYDKYLENFVTTCKPTALSYDRYSLVADGELGPNFWSTLAQVRDSAGKHQLPFWNIILTSPHWQYRDITQADVRLQIWGSLVYGVRGIAYYKFCSKELPILNAPDLGNFRDGPLDQFGEKTPTWEWLRNCNRQVHHLAPTLLALHSDAVYHTGEIPPRNSGPGDSCLVTNVLGGEYVVGDFTHENGSRYVMVVNKSLKRSARPDIKFRNKPSMVNYVSPITGEHKTYPGRYYWLAPGQGVLLQVQH